MLHNFLLDHEEGGEFWQGVDMEEFEAEVAEDRRAHAAYQTEAHGWSHETWTREIGGGGRF